MAPRFEPLLEPFRRVAPRAAAPSSVGRAGAGKARLPFVRNAPLSGWGPFLQFGSRTAKHEDVDRILHTRALVLEAPDGARVALVTIDLHGGSRYVTEKAAALLADEGFHPANLYLCGTHNHAGPGGLYASPYFDAFAASTGIFSGGTFRVGFNQTLADVMALRVEKAVREAVRTLRPARLGSSHQVRLGRWSRQRSPDALRANFPGSPAEEIIERFQNFGGGESSVDGVARWALDARVQTIAAFEAAEGPPRLIGSFSTFGSHCALFSREHERQSAGFFGEAAGIAEAKYPGAVVALAAGAVGDVDPLPPGLTFEQLLLRRATLEQNVELCSQQARGLAAGLLSSIDNASRHQSALHAVAPRLLEDEIAGASVEGRSLPQVPQIGIPTLAGSEMGNGDIRIGWFQIHMREGVRKRLADPNDPHWVRTQSNWDDLETEPSQRALGQLAAMLSFSTTRPFLKAQYRRLPLRYLELELDDRTLNVLGVPGEPTTWLAAELARLTPASERTIVAAVTGDYAGYFTTEAEYSVQQYEGGSTIWGRHTERWLKAQVRRLVRGEGTQRPLGEPEFRVLRERWVTRIVGDSGEMTWK